MSYLIDTNIIAEVRKGSRCDAQVARWWARGCHPGPWSPPAPRCDAQVARWWARVADADLFLSVLVLGEIRKGVELARPRDPIKAVALERWLDAVSQAFAQRILPIDQAVADAWGRLNAPHPRPTVDSLLAATAQVYDLILVTRNLADVKHAGIKLLNPFAAQ